MELNQSDTPAPLNEGHVDSRDFRIQAVTLISSSGIAKEIFPIVAEIQVRQDMYLGFMSGELVLTDGIDLHSQLVLHGGEYLYLHLTVPQQDIAVKKAFRVYKIGNRSSINSFAQRYTVYFMSNELFDSYSKKISKAYPDSKISDIIKDILKTHLSIPDNKMFIEETESPVSVVLPTWRPSESINWLTSRAYASEKNTFFFYENLEGFHFKSIQSIWKSTPPISAPYTLEHRGIRQLDSDKFAIDQIESKKDFDILSTIGSGGFAMQLQTVNPIDRVLTNLYTYKLDDLETLYDNPSMSNGDDLFDKHESYQLTYLPTDGIENWIKRTMHLAILNNSMSEVVVPGNMGLQVGTLVELKIPYTVVPSDGDMTDKRKSGNYLILAVNHKFDMINHKFTSLMMVTRDSYPESIPEIDKNLSDKIKKLNK